MTPRQQAIANGIKPCTYDMRIQLGWTPEDAAMTPARRINDDFAKVARSNGISPATYANRVKRGWGKIRAATTKPRPYYQDNKSA